PGAEHAGAAGEHDGGVVGAGVEGGLEVGEEGRVEGVDLAVVEGEGRDAALVDVADDGHAIPTSTACWMMCSLVALRRSARVTPTGRSSSASRAIRRKNTRCGPRSSSATGPL